MRRLLALILLLPAIAYSATTASVSLTWNRAADHDASTTFRIYYGTASGEYSDQLDAGTATEISVPGLTPGVTYYFMATARQDGLESEPSEELRYTIPTGSPVSAVTVVEAFRVANQTTLNWAANPADQLIFQYEVTYVRTGTSDEPTSVMVTTPTVVLPTDTLSTYLVRIRAIGPAGAGPWFDRVLPGLKTPSSVFISRNGNVQYRWTP